MNPKNALFLSASLTAFVLAVLFGVVTKVTNTPTVAAAAPVVQAATATIPPTGLPSEEILPVATQQGPLGPEEAANLAAKAISRQDVYSVETFSYKGADSYKVVFSSGDIVYIGMDRMVLEMGKLQPVVISVDAPTSLPKKHKGGSNYTQQSSAPTAPPAPGGGDGGGEPGDN